MAVALFVLVAVWALVPGRARQLSIAVGTVIAVAGWVVVQGLGDVTSGHATDLNSGPLMVLLALAVVGANRPRTFDDAPRDVVVERREDVTKELVDSVSS